MKSKWVLGIALLLIGIYSCEEVFDRNLKKEDIAVLAPPDNHRATGAVTFWWEEVKGADEYRLQVVSPSFASIQQLVLDTTIKDDRFTYTFQPGTYQWRIRAENGSSSTDFVVRTLTIDSTTDLSNQIVLLQSPSDNYLTNQPQQTFKWQKLYNADEYRVQIAQPAFSGNYTTVTDVIVTTDSFTYTLTAGAYQWRVRAQNSSSNSAYSTRNITIDLTAPAAPALIAPGNDSLVMAPVTLKWSPDAKAWGDTLYVYSDSLVTGIIKSFLTDTFYSFSSTAGDYFWRVRSVDSAGNVSNYSNVYKFIIQ